MTIIEQPALLGWTSVIFADVHMTAGCLWNTGFARSH